MAARVAAAVALAAAAALLTACLTAGPPSAAARLVVTDAETSRVLHAERVEPGARFVLAYTHSSERVPVRGTFVVRGDGTFLVSETAFAGFGPGLPEIRPGVDPWRIENGMIVRQGGGEPMRELTVRVSDAARQRLELPSGVTLDLVAAAGEGHAVRVSLE